MQYTIEYEDNSMRIVEANNLKEANELASLPATFYRPSDRIVTSVKRVRITTDQDIYRYNNLGAFKRELT